VNGESRTFDGRIVKIKLTEHWLGWSLQFMAEYSKISSAGTVGRQVRSVINLSKAHYEGRGEGGRSERYIIAGYTKKKNQVNCMS